MGADNVIVAAQIVLKKLEITANCSILAAKIMAVVDNFWYRISFPLISSRISNKLTIELWNKIFKKI